DPTDRNTLLAASVDKARVIVVAGNSLTEQQIIIQHVLELNPDITIICKVLSKNDTIGLANKGANIIINPETEAIVSIGRSILSLYKIPGSAGESFIKVLRKE